jgi:hypothetical protein
MILLDLVLNAKGGDAVRQLANQFGVSEDQAASALQNLMPALAGGLQRNINQGGLEKLLGAPANGQHHRYLEDPSTLSSEATIQDGNGILGHILGSKDVSRQVAAQASTRTGISESILKQMLPVVASLAMGSLSRHAATVPPSATGVPAESAGGSGILGMLTPLLDRNRDGSGVDDILGSASRFFQK